MGLKQRWYVRLWIWTRTKPKAPARCFSEPKCQDRLCFWYLFYRWLVFAAWFSFTISSFFEEFTYSDETVYGYDKWPIYYTNWVLTLGLIQSFLGVVLVTRRWCYQSNPGFDPDQLVCGWLESFYWYFYVVTMSMAIGETIFHWSMVYDSSLGIGVIEILIHVGNSVLMLMDFALMDVPFDLRHVSRTTFVSSFYIIFSVVYYKAGGLYRGEKTYVYTLLDWAELETALLGAAVGVNVLIITHILLHLLARCKDSVCGRRREPEKFSTCKVEPYF